MKKIKISPITQKFIVRYSGIKIYLPIEIQQKINAYWDSLLNSGKNYTRGEVFTVTKKEISRNKIEILVEKTDYAHYLYCQNIDQLGDFGVHIIHTAVVVNTKDDKIIFGRMGKHTSRVGIYQLCGGGIDNKDLTGNLFDFDHNIKKELQEELGINAEDSARVVSFGPAYFKQGGPTDKMTVVFNIRLNETSQQFLEAYNDFVESIKMEGECPEFGKIVVLENKSNSISRFFDRKDVVFDEYMRPLFGYIAKYGLKLHKMRYISDTLNFKGVPKIKG
jgi:hypothetical protein